MKYLRICGCAVTVSLALYSNVYASNQEEEASTSLDLWDDPVFQRRFMGSYGMKSEVEPDVTSVEKEQMEEVMVLMSGEQDMDRARVKLHGLAKPSASAVFDFTLANIYFQQDDYEAATNWFVSAIGKFPSFQRAHKNLGLVYVRMGKHKKAAGPLTKAIEFGANDGLTFGLLGFANLSAGRHTAAEGAYRQAIMLQPETLDWRLGLARTLFRQERHAEAATLCSELIDLHPDRAEYWMLQANAYLGLGKPMKAAENYEYLDLSGNSTSRSLTLLGDIYVNQKLMDLAAHAYIRAMERGNEQADPSGFIRNAEVLVARGAYEEGEEVIKAMTKLRADNLGKEQRIRLLKLQTKLAAARGAAVGEQVELLQSIINLDPLDGDSLIMLGEHYAREGQLEKAIFYFERAEGIDEYNAKASLKHAQALIRAERYRDALPLLKKAQERNPREDVAEYIRQLERLSNLEN